MTLDPKALEAAARAICVNPDEVTMGSGSTGSTESETIVYRRAWQDVLPIAQAAITAYLAALASSPPVSAERVEQADVLWTVGTHHSWWKSSVRNWRDLDPIAKSEFLAIADRLSASPSPPALDGAGRDAVLEEIAKWLEEQAEADFTMAEDMPEYSPDGYRLMLRRKWRKADAAAIRVLKETP